MHALIDIRVCVYSVYIHICKCMCVKMNRQIYTRSDSGEVWYGGGDGRDKRPVIVNKVWGLDNPKRAATVMVAPWPSIRASSSLWIIKLYSGWT